MRRPPVPGRRAIGSIMDDLCTVRPGSEVVGVASRDGGAREGETERFVEALKAGTDVFVDLRASGLRTLPGAVAPASIEALATVAGRRVLLGDRADPYSVVIEERIPKDRDRGTEGPRGSTGWALRALPPRVFDRRAVDGGAKRSDRRLARGRDDDEALRRPGSAGQVLALIRRCGRDADALRVLVRVARDAVASGELELDKDAESLAVLELFERFEDLPVVSDEVENGDSERGEADAQPLHGQGARGAGVGGGAAASMDPLLRSFRGAEAVVDADGLHGSEFARRARDSRDAAAGDAADDDVVPGSAGVVERGDAEYREEREELSVDELAMAASRMEGDWGENGDPVDVGEASPEDGNEGCADGDGRRPAREGAGDPEVLGGEGGAGVPVLRGAGVARRGPVSPMLSSVVREALGDGAELALREGEDRAPETGEQTHVAQCVPSAAGSREADEAQAGRLDPVHLRWASQAWSLAGEDREASALCTLAATISLVEMWTSLDVVGGRCSREEHWGTPLGELLGYELALRLSERSGAWPEALEAKRPVEEVRPEATQRIRYAAALLRCLGAVTRDRAVEMRLDAQLKALRGDPVFGVGRLVLRRDWSVLAEGLDALHRVPGVMVQWPDAHRHMAWSAHHEELGYAADFLCVIAVDGRARRRAQSVRARSDGSALVDSSKARSSVSGRALTGVGLVTCTWVAMQDEVIRVSVSGRGGAERVVAFDIAEYREALAVQTRAWHVGEELQTVFCVPLEAFDRLDSSDLCLPEGFHLTCFDARCGRSWIDLVLDVLGCRGLLDAETNPAV